MPIVTLDVTFIVIINRSLKRLFCRHYDEIQIGVGISQVLHVRTGPAVFPSAEWTFVRHGGVLLRLSCWLCAVSRICQSGVISTSRVDRR